MTIMTFEETTKYLKISSHHLHALIRKEPVPCFKLGRLFRFDKEKLDKYLESKLKDADKVFRPA